jgi:N-acetylneuraminate synthase
MKHEIKINGRAIGENHPTYIIGEIGINHNGDINIAKKLIDMAVIAGFDAVKFQKRTPELAVPPEQRDVIRETPWGKMTYMEYRKRTEFGEKEYSEIDRYCKEKKIDWFASVWDVEAVDFMEKMKTIAYKIPSAALTDHQLLKKVKNTGKPIILSTGMSTNEQIDGAISALGNLENTLIMQATSTYPSNINELNLKVINTYKNKYKCPIGYSGHEFETIPTIAAVALGACAVERHITLDRNMWGSDQKASLDPSDQLALVKGIRIVEKALGDGEKKLYESEVPSMKRLRRN